MLREGSQRGVANAVRGCLGRGLRARREEISLVIASSATRDWVVPHLERAGILTWFDHLVCGDGLPAKPDPVVYLAALKLIGAAAGRALAVEDSPTGVRAAHAAGITCVGLINAVHPAAALVEADRQVGSLDELWAADTTPTPVGGVSCAC